MMKGRYIAGLDVGTTKIFTIVGLVKDDKFEIVAVGKAQSNGLRKGIVVDMDSTVNSIKESVRNAEELSGIKINEVYVGIAGGHIKSFKSSGAVAISDGIVEQRDIDRVMDTAQAVYVPLDREVLHIVPIEYIVDGEGDIQNPIGMKGVRLEANIQLVTGSVTSVQNLLKCCERCGLNVVEIVLEPLASAMAALTDDEKRDGAILIDIGGGTSDIILFKNNSFVDVSIISVGGNHFTNDIGIGLRLPYVEAERIKKAYGSAMFVDGDDDTEINVMVANRVETTVPRRVLVEIIRPRCAELVELVKKEIEKMSGFDMAPYGVVLTGGASQLHGMDRMFIDMLKLPVRIGGPVGMGVTNSLESPIYTTSVGLLLYALYNSAIQEEGARLNWDFFGIKNTISNWFKEIFTSRK